MLFGGCIFASGRAMVNFLIFLPQSGGPARLMIWGHIYIYTDKTSLKADREAWGRGMGVHLVSLGFTWLPFVSLGFTWLHLATLGVT